MIVIVFGTAVLTLLLIPAAYLVIYAFDYTDYSDVEIKESPLLGGFQEPLIYWETLPDEFLNDDSFDRRHSLIYFNGNSINFRPDELYSEELCTSKKNGLNLYRFDAPGEGESDDFTLRYAMVTRLFPTITSPTTTTAFAYFDNESVASVLLLSGPIDKMPSAQIEDLKLRLNTLISMGSKQPTAK